MNAPTVNELLELFFDCCLNSMRVFEDQSPQEYTPYYRWLARATPELVKEFRSQWYYYAEIRAARDDLPREEKLIMTGSRIHYIINTFMWPYDVDTANFCMCMLETYGGNFNSENQNFISLRRLLQDMPIYHLDILALYRCVLKHSGSLAESRENIYSLRGQVDEV